MRFKKNLFTIVELYSSYRSRFYLHWNHFKFRMYGVEFGKNLSVYNKVYILGSGKVKIGDDVVFTSGDSINPICRNIRGSIYTMTPESKVEIGDRVGLSSTSIWAKEKIVIGNDVNIGGDSIIIDNDAHPHDYIQRRLLFRKSQGEEIFYKTIPTAPIEIGDDVWIGARCLILKGVHIGARSIIAAGSVVTKDIPSDVIAGGNPCKVIRHLHDNNK